MGDVIGIGRPFMDFLVNVSHFPKERDELVPLLQMSWQGGGKVATALIAAAELGNRTAFFGIAGDDIYGRFLKDDFVYYGVDVSRMALDGANAFSLVISETETSGRIIMPRECSGRDILKSDIDLGMMRGYKYLLLEKVEEATLFAAGAMKEYGNKVAFDVDPWNWPMDDMIGYLDVFIGSEFCYRSLFGASIEYAENFKTIGDMGPQIVVFTFGSRGCGVLYGGRFEFVPAFNNVVVVDTVGCGDVFRGAYLSFLVKGFDPFKAAKYANAVSSIKCARIGGRAGIPNFEETESFIKTGTLDFSRIDAKVRRYETISGSRL